MCENDIMSGLPNKYPGFYNNDNERKIFHYYVIDIYADNILVFFEVYKL